MSTTVQRTKDHLVGFKADGERVFVSLDLRPHVSSGQRTVTHQPIGDYIEFSASGLLVPKGYRDAEGAGQCLDALLEVTEAKAPFTLDDIKSLHALWKEWHLNGMNAGCVHQAKVVWEDSTYGKRVDLKGTTEANDCPANYRYGSAWLVKPLPDDVKTEIERLRDLLVQCPEYKGR